MPISTNPHATAPFSLASDRELPLSTRPAFLVRFMTELEHKRHDELMRQAAAELDDRRCAELLIAAVRIGVVGWRNFTDPASGQPIAFSDQAFFDVLPDTERWEVAWRYPDAVRLTRIDLGNSASPATSAGPANAVKTTAESAPAASRRKSR